MSDIGEDLKEALEEVGAAYTIIRESGNISGEYGLLEHSAQVTKPITIEHFRRFTAPYDTQAITGDVVEIDETGVRFLATNRISNMFENAVYQYDMVLYKCNVASGELFRPSGETWDDSTDQYHKTPTWETIKDNCDAMQVASLYGNDLDADNEIALMGLRNDEVLLPHSVGARVLDRWQPASGEYYLVGKIETRRYPDIDVLAVEEDNR